MDPSCFFPSAKIVPIIPPYILGRGVEELGNALQSVFGMRLVIKNGEVTKKGRSGGGGG